MKITNHHELRKRCSIKCNHKKMTDQSFKKACDINIIIANATKTGLLSHQTEKVAQYIDNTQIPSLLDAQNLIRHANEAFMSLPAKIRRMMNHDPTKLVDFVNDPDNKELLIKNGILEQFEISPKEKSEPPKAEPAVVEKTKEL